jgi:hypothetical protein
MGETFYMAYLMKGVEIFEKELLLFCLSLAACPQGPAANLWLIFSFIIKMS